MPAFFGRASELRAKGKERQNKYLWYLPLTFARRQEREPPFFLPPPLLVASDGRDVNPHRRKEKKSTSVTVPFEARITSFYTACGN